MSNQTSYGRDCSMKGETPGGGVELSAGLGAGDGVCERHPEHQQHREHQRADAGGEQCDLHDSDKRRSTSDVLHQLCGGLFGVLATTNMSSPLTNWTALSGVMEIAPGQFQFSDPQAANGGQRFYRLYAP
jgi:hypothetical protein